MGSAYTWVRLEDALCQLSCGWWRWKASWLHDVCLMQWVAYAQYIGWEQYNIVHTSDGVTWHFPIKLVACTVLASLKLGHLPVVRPWFSQISTGLQAVSCNYRSYCVICSSDSYLQFIFSAYMWLTNFDQIFAGGTGLAYMQIDTRVYVVNRIAYYSFIESYLHWRLLFPIVLG